MQSKSFYPIIIAKNIVETINFYEDHFGFIPELEMDCFAVLRHEKYKDMRLGIIKEGHSGLPDTHKKVTTQGLLLNFPVKRVNDVYKDMYMEGLDILGKPAIASCGRRHFMVSDPNGVLIDVMEEVDPFTMTNDNEELEKMMELMSV